LGMRGITMGKSSGARLSRAEPKARRGEAKERMLTAFNVL